MITARLLAPDPGQLPGGDWVFLTRRAEEIHDKDAFEAFRKASALLEAGYCRPRTAELSPGRPRHRRLPSLQGG